MWKTEKGGEIVCIPFIGQVNDLQTFKPQIAAADVTGQEKQNQADGKPQVRVDLSSDFIKGQGKQHTYADQAQNAEFDDGVRHGDDRDDGDDDGRPRDDQSAP